MHETLNFIVPVELHLTRVDNCILQYIKNHLTQHSEILSNLSRTYIQKLIESGNLEINKNKTTTSNTKVKKDEVVVLQIPPAEPIDLEPKEGKIDVLFEDEDLIILNKSQNLVVHPTSSQNEDTLVHFLLSHTKNLSGIGGKLRPGIIHRLDKNTSGALVVTKNDFSHLHLSEAFQRHEIHKTYWALCYQSCQASTEKRIETWIKRNPNDRKKMMVDPSSGKNAISLVTTLEEFKKKSALNAFASFNQIVIETGRTHQIRVHLTHLGCSVLGDPTYGIPTTNQTKWKNLPEDVKELLPDFPGQALHARTISFKHPRTNKLLTIHAEPPKIFQKLLSLLRSKYSEK